ncbi:hypothetical protein D9611_006642 [Ephemerocybe angulata]|uniref:NACHT domain-containing protein n=1 Tax=Ephemerocybe angulata TaxID=980116 RepID=A0A8H5FGM4_9AGAR|nr:hypothetical protein D9611_006642 [Tulosesus angulatus]
MTDIPGKSKPRSLRGHLKKLFRRNHPGQLESPRSRSPSVGTSAGEGSERKTSVTQPGLLNHTTAPDPFKGRSNRVPSDLVADVLDPKPPTHLTDLTCDGTKGRVDEDNPSSSKADCSVSTAGIGTKAYEGIKTSLRMAAQLGDVFPPVKSTAAGLLFIFDIVDAYGENRGEFDKLLKRVEVLSAIIASCPRDVSQEALDRFSGLSRTLREKEELLKQKLNPNRSKIERAILSSKDKEDVLKVTQEIKTVIEIAMFESITRNEQRTLQVVGGINWLKEHVEIIEQASGAIYNVERDVEFLRKSEVLKKLGDVEGAEHTNPDSGTGCTPGSRLSLLAALLVWASDPRSSHIFWLSGPAGTGKTAVSKTFCSQLAARKILGASFFCTLKERDLRNVYLIIPTLAKILAEERPDFGNALEQVLKSDRSCRTPTKMALKEQYLKLILEPAAKVFTPEDLLVVCIDALDECEDKDAIGQLLATLSRQPTVPLKFFLTSRPEISLRASFQPLNTHEWLRLYDIEDHVVKADIMLFLTERFRDVPVIYETYKDTWPPLEIEKIAEFSGKLFIVAFTAFKYITAPNGICLRRFKDFVQQSSDIKTRGVEALYEGILVEAFKDLEPSEQALIHSCLSLLVVAQKPLSPYDYGRLLDMDTYLVREAFKTLHSVVNIPDDQLDHDPISIYHASFVDFVVSERCRHRGEQWAIEVAGANSAAGDSCFRIMESMLCLGISGAKTSYKSNDDQPEPLKLPSELAYACIAWGGHVLSAGLSERWEQKVASTRLQELSNSIGDFIHNFETAITHSAPHLYLSAIPFHAALRTTATQASLPVFQSIPIVHHRRAIGREMFSVKIGAFSACQCLAFSPDGKYVAAAINSEKLGTWAIRVYTRGGQHARGVALMEHAQWISAIAYSPNGRYIASSSQDGAIRLWDAQTGLSTSKPLRGHNSIAWGVSYSPDGRYIASGSADNTVRLWDVETMQQAVGPLSGHTAGVQCVAFSPNGKYVVSGSADKSLRMWDAHTGQAVLEPMTGHTGMIRSVAYSPDGERIVSGSHDCTIRIWDMHTGRTAVGPITSHGAEVTCVAFSSNGNLVLSASSDKMIRLWDARTGEAACEPFLGHTHEVISAAYSPDGRCIVTGSIDNTIRFWDAEMELPASNSASSHVDMITAVAYSPDGSCIASSSETNAVRIWDARTGGLSLALDRTDDGAGAHSVAYSPDGKLIASAINDKTVRVWHAQTGKAAFGGMVGHSDIVECAVFSPDGKTIASGSADSTIRLWDSHTGEPLGDPMTGHSAVVYTIAWSPDGNHLVSCSKDKTVCVWDLTGAQRVFEPMTGHDDVVWSVAYSPDGKHIASGSRDTTIRVWDAETMRSVFNPITGHTEAVLAVAYSPNGKFLASASHDGTIQLWDARTMKPELAPIIGHGAGIHSLAFSPTGDHIASVSFDTTLRVWKLPQSISMLVASPIQASQSHDGDIFLHDYPHGTYTIRRDGWVRNSSDDLLLWVPPACRSGLYCSGLEHIIGNIATTKVELSRAIAHGVDWLKVYIAS